MTTEQTATITITQDTGYRFSIDFGAAIPALQTDEVHPISDGDGPCPEQLLLASTANCLCASLFFALTKFRQDPQGLSATATCRIERNANRRLRIVAIDVDITIGADASDFALDMANRALAQFEDFCTVSESIRQGIPTAVRVLDRHGTRLK